jgi:hypothetical protein
MEYFGVFKGLFGYCVLISFRSYAGIRNALAEVIISQHDKVFSGS